jgi:hypothetical protein
MTTATRQATTDEVKAARRLNKILDLIETYTGDQSPEFEALQLNLYQVSEDIELFCERHPLPA